MRRMPAIHELLQKIHNLGRNNLTSGRIDLRSDCLRLTRRFERWPERQLLSIHVNRQEMGMRHRRRKALVRVGWLLSLSWLALSHVGAAEQSAPARAHIGFGSTINDAEVRAVLTQQNVAASAVFMWSTGFTGTYRSYDTRSSEQLLKEAREQAIAVFEKAQQSNREQIQSFLDKNTDTQVDSSEELQLQARSLLNTQAQIEDALRAARAGQPLVFGVDVSGETAQLEQLQKIKEVKAFELVQAAENDRRAVSGTASARQRAIKPATYNAEYRDARVQTISPSRLREFLTTTTRSERTLGELLMEVDHARL